MSFRECVSGFSKEGKCAGEGPTRKVVKASVLTSKAPPSIQGKNFQKTPSPDCISSTSISSNRIVFSSP